MDKELKRSASTKARIEREQPAGTSVSEVKKTAMEVERPTLPGPMRAYVADERKMIDKSRDLSLSNADGEEHKVVVTHDLYNDGVFYNRKDVAPKDENQFKRHAPEVGKNYQGHIVLADDRHVIQAVKDGRGERYILHERKDLNSSQKDLLVRGAKVEIRYLYERVAIVKAPQEREHSNRVSRGIEPRGRV